MSRVLLVEDDDNLAEGLAFNLRNIGYEVETTGSGEAALAATERRSFDLVLLDVMLPGIDGLEVVRRLRKAGNRKPVLMITARNRGDDAIAGLDAGADDYIVKPFDLDEVLARIRGALRREVWARGEAVPNEPGPLVYGAWTIDFPSFVATASDGRVQPLTATEAAMLRLFARRPGEVISRETFLREVWGRTGAIETRTVDNFVRKLRRALEPDPAKPRHIVSVRAAGYKFVP
ncbi:MAG TPA: response regulator transcription factor [Planctomycetota bacterium]|nr:response regulator transcription factor [Planctomycetota bacterium]